MRAGGIGGSGGLGGTTGVTSKTQAWKVGEQNIPVGHSLSATQAEEQYRLSPWTKQERDWHIDAAVQLPP